MAEIWPLDLPQRLNVNGHSYTFGDIAIRSNPAVGPAKIRPRSSVMASPLSGQMFMSTAQLTSLKTFYQITVRGSDVFIFPDPAAWTSIGPNIDPQPTINCRFAGPPAVAATTVAGTWSVALSMEVVP